MEEMWKEKFVIPITRNWGYNSVGRVLSYHHHHVIPSMTKLDTVKHVDSPRTQEVERRRPEESKVISSANVFKNKIKSRIPQ